MERITRKHLDNALERLNEVSKRRWMIYGAYGKVQLCYYVEKDSSMLCDATGLHTKRELFEIIHAILKYCKAERLCSR